MDLSIAIAIGTGAFTLTQGTLGYIVRGTLKRIDNLEAANQVLRDKINGMEVTMAKDYVTNPGLLKVMESFDRAIDAMAKANTESRAELLNALNQLNRRIDDFMRK